RQPPRQATGLVRHVEVRRDLESLERFEDQPERREDQQRPPPDAQVAGDVVVHGVVSRQVGQSLVLKSPVPTLNSASPKPPAPSPALTPDTRAAGCFARAPGD